MELLKYDNLATQKMLTISTAHITRETANWLDDNIEDISVYQKEDVGWFIYINKGWFEPFMNDLAIPEDLMTLIQFSVINKIDVLCLDSTADTLDILPEYGWDENDDDILL